MLSELRTIPVRRCAVRFRMRGRVNARKSHRENRQIYVWVDPEGFEAPAVISHFLVGVR